MTTSENSGSRDLISRLDRLVYQDTKVLRSENKRETAPSNERHSPRISKLNPEEWYRSNFYLSQVQCTVGRYQITGSVTLPY